MQSIMSRHIQISCPHCHRPGLRIRTEFLGRSVLCKHCGKDFVSQPPDDLAADSSGSASNHELSQVSLEAAHHRIEQLQEHIRALQASVETCREPHHLGSAVQEGNARQRRVVDVNATHAQQAPEVFALREEIRSLREERDGSAREFEQLRRELGDAKTQAALRPTPQSFEMLQQQVAALSDALRKSREANQRLSALLNVFGVLDEAKTTAS